MPVHDGCWWKGSERNGRQSAKPCVSIGGTADSQNSSKAGYGDVLDAVATIGPYLCERLPLEEFDGFASSNDETTNNRTE